MSYGFNAKHGLVVAKARLWGPDGKATLSLAVDTGATGTLISQTRLIELGYDASTDKELHQITTGSGIEFVPVISLDKIVALDQERFDFPVLCHNLPPSAGVDGLLGLDFFRGKNLNIDFRNGLITLS
ncbi:MAG: aspartyl protease family protein [Blastocatellales bacterium]